MGKPRLIILVRHAQSEGNKNREIHQTIPDHRVKLTADGWNQAHEAGRRLRELLKADDTLHFFTSPYRRTRETTEGILATLTSDDPEPSPFKRNNIKVYEEPRLREQDFGNFQPCSAEMERMWQERADYGHFFYRIPSGESAADAYDRVSGFNESLWRQFGEDDFASVCVLVTHGLMSRVFLMKWYHFTVEYFEDLRNVNHCEFLIMRKSPDSGKYILENKLRTWSELRRERALLASKEKEAALKDDNDLMPRRDNLSSKDGPKTEKPSQRNASANFRPVEIRRRWGGCPNGCNHDKNFKIRQTLADLVKRDGTASDSANSNSNNLLPTGASIITNGMSHAAQINGSDTPPPSTDKSYFDDGLDSTANGSLIYRHPTAKRFQSNASSISSHDASTEHPPQRNSADGPHIDITAARDGVVSSPDGTPSFLTVEDRLRRQLKSPSAAPYHTLLHLGRDFGGSYSGHNSVAASDDESSEDDSGRHRRRLAHPKTAMDGRLEPHHHKSRGRANRLGDAPHSSDGEHEADGEHEVGGDDDEDGDEGFAKLEEAEKSIQGSVY